MILPSRFGINVMLSLILRDLKNGGLTQFFEFRCLDEQVSYVRCLSKREIFICGFESGSLRVFDIQKCTVLGELESHKAQVIDIQVSPDDKFIASVDISGKIQIFDSNLNYIKELQSNHLEFN
jgi:WD40 repeat protein